MINNRIKELRKNSNMSQKDVEKKIGYSQSIIARWEKGLTEPTLPALIALSNCFKCSIDFIAKREYEDGTYQAPQLSENEHKLLNGYNQLNKIAKARLMAYLDGLLESPLAKEKLL